MWPYSPQTNNLLLVPCPIGETKSNGKFFCCHWSYSLGHTGLWYLALSPETIGSPRETDEVGVGICSRSHSLEGDQVGPDLARLNSLLPAFDLWGPHRAVLRGNFRLSALGLNLYLLLKCSLPPMETAAGLGWGESPLALKKQGGEWGEGWKDQDALSCEWIWLMCYPHLIGV